MSRRILAVGVTGIACLGGAVLLLGLGLDEGPPVWPGNGPVPAAWPGSWPLGPWHAALGAALALGLLGALALAVRRLRGGPRVLVALAGLDTLLLAGSGLALAPGGWRDGGLPAGLEPWLAAGMIEAAADAHAASLMGLPLLLAAAWAWTWACGPAGPLRAHPPAAPEGSRPA